MREGAPSDSTSRSEPARVEPESSLPPSDLETPDAPDRSTGRWFWRVCHMIARWPMTFLFDLKVYGRSHVPRRGGCLIVSNHQSYLDPVLIGVFLARPMAYLAKSELFKNPYFGWLIRSLNAFPIKQGAGDVGAVKELIKRLKEGWLANVFVEGSRTETGELMPVQAGAALVIRRADVPVVPCVIQGSFKAWPRTRKFPRPHPVAVMYGPALNLRGLKANQITQLIDRTLHEMVAELRRIDRRIS